MVRNMTCHSMGEPEPLIKWYRFGELLENNQTNKIYEMGRNSALQVGIGLNFLSHILSVLTAIFCPNGDKISDHGSNPPAAVSTLEQFHSSHIACVFRKRLKPSPGVYARRSIVCPYCNIYCPNGGFGKKISENGSNPPAAVSTLDQFRSSHIACVFRKR